MSQVAFNDEWIPESPTEWSKWLKEQEDRTLRVYNDDPDRLIADYRREKQISRGYQGREILELLQNANDAAAELGSLGAVRIELSDEGLIFANTGKPFSTGGINSFRITDLSPKLRRKTKFIGQKGLGFRAILNWSRQPYISSGSLRLLFSKERLRILSLGLSASNEAVARLVNLEKAAPEEVILPSLPFPTFLSESPTNLESEPRQLQTIVKRCEELRTEYETVIGMPFVDTSILNIAQLELQELRPEVLLFTKNLESILLNAHGREDRCWKVTGDSVRLLTVAGATENVRKFKIEREQHDIPPEYVSQGSSSKYEIAIAIPLNQNLTEPFPLFSFFPTNLTFPFPVICHATLELDSSRKYPQEGQPNDFIFERIAILLANTAQAREATANPWLKAETVLRMRDYETSLQRAEFGAKLLRALRQKKIVPTIGREHKVGSEVVRIEARNLAWLPLAEFSDVCLPETSKLLEILLSELQVKTLSSEEFRTRLNSIQFGSIDERAKVIVGLLHENITPTKPGPNLLINKNGDVIPADERIYFFPEGGEGEYPRPQWLKLHFVHDSLREALSEALGVKDRRDLRQKLTAYGVQEYSLANIATAIAVDCRIQMDSDPNRAAQYEQDMLIALYLLFPKEGTPPKLSETTAVPLPNKLGRFVDARILYFSENYGENGNLLASLYKRRPELLVAGPENIGLEGKSENTVAFLKWLGMASLPREQKIERLQGEFVNYVMDNISYPMRNEKYVRMTKADFLRPHLEDVITIDGIDDILKADPAAVITWLALDNRAYGWGRSSDGNGELCDQPFSSPKIYRFATFIPSFVRWKIQSTAWLPATNGELVEPRKCMLGERVLEKLLPPPADLQHELFGVYKINSRLKRNALENAGVTPDISHLEPEQIYEIIAQMPKLDPAGKHARAFYINLLERIDTDMIRWPEVPLSFRQSVTMWGRGPEGERYYPIHQLLHADSEDFPDLLCQHLTLVDLKKRAGSNKVRRLFGIEPIDKKKVRQTIRRAVELPDSKDIQAQFQRTKPYLYYLRSVRSKQASDIRSLESLQLVLCSTLDVHIEYENLQLPTTLDKHLQWLVEDNYAYILYTHSVRPSLESDLLADSIGEIVANLFDLAQGGEYSRLIRCPEFERLNLLRRILGVDEIPGFEEMRSEFDQAIKEFEMEIPIEPEVPVEPVPPLGPTPTEEAAPPLETQISDTGVGDITSTKTPHIPEPGPKRREVVTRFYGGKQPGGDRSGLKRIIDPEICEKRIFQFEQQETRFPIKVSTVTGYNGPRCDILSFSSRANLESFRDLTLRGRRDLSLVSRFIEVKGRSSDNSPISLKGNELDAARTFGKNYYLYRLYLENSNKYLLFILQDPLNHPEAIEEVKDIFVNRAPSDRYDIIINHEDVDVAKEPNS